MKIAYIANSRFPSEKAQSDQVMAMCSAFAKAGHTVKLFVPDRRPVMAEDPFVYYGAAKSFSFERVPCVDALRWRWLGALGHWIQTFTFIQSLRSRLAEFNPDIVYSREPYVFAFGALPGKHVWESHILHRSRWAKHLIKSLDAIVTLTRVSRERLVSQGVASDRVVVEPDAVDPALFNNAPSREEARRALGVAADEFLCLYTGKFRMMGEGKGVEEAVEATHLLRAQDLPVRFMAVGGTPEELAAYVELEHKGVGLVGHQPQKELKRFYAAADLLLMPHPWNEHYAYYVSPLKLFEYLRAGVPMVVSDLPSLREIVDESSAFFAKPGDAASLAEAIKTAMNDPEEAKRRAGVARQLADTYTWEARARRITDWIASLPKRT